MRWLRTWIGEQRVTDPGVELQESRITDCLQLETDSLSCGVGVNHCLFSVVHQVSAQTLIPHVAADDNGQDRVNRSLVIRSCDRRPLSDSSGMADDLFVAIQVLDQEDVMCSASVCFARQ